MDELKKMNERYDYEIPSWDEYFMSMIYLISTRSKDIRTNIGAVIVGEDHNIISTGYNGFPMGIRDDIPERHTKELKYYYFEHAERNAIYLAIKNGASFKNSTMYTNGLPCADCARAIIQVGIKNVKTHKQWENLYNIGNNGSGITDLNFKASIEMFEEAGIEWISMNIPLIAFPFTEIRARGILVEYDNDLGTVR